MKIRSSVDKLQYFSRQLNLQEIVDINSDLKHRIFPRSFERLTKINKEKNLVGVEIGVCGGEHAESLLKNLDIKMLYLIDPYDMYDEYVQSEGWEYGNIHASLDVSFASAKKLLSQFSSKITFVKQHSAKAIHKIPEHIDFVYIDGNHDYEFVKQDLELYYKKIKSGGVIGGHDFYNGFAHTHNSVVTSVIEFAVNNKLQLHVEQPDFWFYKP